MTKRELTPELTQKILNGTATEEELSEYPEMDDLTRYYSERYRQIGSELFRMFRLERGQCQGRLVSDGRKVLVACCIDLADAVCFEGMHIHERLLYKAAQTVSVDSDDEGGTYVIPADLQMGLDHCPFCGAPILFNTIYLREQGL